jgi:hypothetical protein
MGHEFVCWRFPCAANATLCGHSRESEEILSEKVAESSNDFSEVLMDNPDISTSSDEDASGFVIEGLTILRNCV